MVITAYNLREHELNEDIEIALEELLELLGDGDYEDNKIEWLVGANDGYVMEFIYQWDKDNVAILKATGISNGEEIDYSRCHKNQILAAIGLGASYGILELD